MRRLRPLDPTASPVHAFAHELRQVREAAGAPSYEAMAAKTHRSRTQLAAAATGGAVPTWETTEAFLVACGVSQTEELTCWKEQWKLLNSVTPAPDSGPTTWVAPIVSTNRQVSLLGALLVGLIACLVTAGATAAGTYRLAQPNLPPAPKTGDDPMRVGCVRDAQLVKTIMIENRYKLDLLWSTTCSANWGRIIRLDGKGFGNRIGVMLYGSFPDAPPALHVERPDIDDIYTPIMVVTDETVCVTGTIWTGATSQPAEQPACR